MALRFTTAGESHGPGLTAVVEGLPAGLELRPEDIDRDLARRQLGLGREEALVARARAEVAEGEHERPAVGGRERANGDRRHLTPRR